MIDRKIFNFNLILLLLTVWNLGLSYANASEVTKIPGIKVGSGFSSYYKHYFTIDKKLFILGKDGKIKEYVYKGGRFYGSGREVGHSFNAHFEHFFTIGDKMFAKKDDKRILEYSYSKQKNKFVGSGREVGSGFSSKFKHYFTIENNLYVVGDDGIILEYVYKGGKFHGPGRNVGHGFGARFTHFFVIDKNLIVRDVKGDFRGFKYVNNRFTENKTISGIQFDKSITHYFNIENELIVRNTKNELMHYPPWYWNATAEDNQDLAHINQLYNIKCFDGITLLPDHYNGLCESINSSDGLSNSLGLITKTTADLKKQADGLKDILSKSNKAESDLKSITNMIGTVKDLLKVAKAIPAISNAAGDLETAVTELERPAIDAQKLFHSLNSRIEPLEKLTTDTDALLEKILKKEENLKLTVENLLNADKEAYKCKPNNKPLNEATKGAKAKIDDLNVELNKAVADYEKAVQEYDFIEYLETQVSHFSPMKTIVVEIDKIHTDLHGITTAIHSIQAILNRKVSFKIDYVYDDYLVQFRISEVIKGLSHIEHELEKLLSDTIYAAAKAIGLGSIFKDLKKSANKLLKKGTDKLNLGAVLKIPGLAEIYKLEKISMNDITHRANGVVSSLEGIEKSISLDEISTELNKIHETIEEYNCKQQ